MKSKLIYSMVLVVVAVLLAGCGESLKYESAKPLMIDGSIEKARAVEVAGQVLKDMHFVIDKADVQTGLVSTRPLSGGQIGEFWRKDSVGYDNLAYSTIHSTQRTVEVNVEQMADGVVVSCDATLYRMALPNREVSSFSDLPGMFSKSSASRQRLRVTKGLSKDIEWEKVGLDGKLAEYILNKISQKIKAD